MEIVWIDTTESTNSYLKEENRIAPMTMVCARKQTAGRGQRGNSWEAEPGKNLTFSFFFAPSGIHAARQFVISQAVALAMVDALRDFGIEAGVKWPNDIYVSDSKIAGILIENSILGETISRSIVGIGLNVNQTVFLSDAPNPVSMASLAGHSFSLKRVAETVACALQRQLEAISDLSSDKSNSLSESYYSSLWRADGREHPFLDAASGETFHASVAAVEPSGHLILKRSDGRRHRYAFKEVVFVL